MGASFLGHESLVLRLRRRPQARGTRSTSGAEHPKLYEVRVSPPRPLSNCRLPWRNRSRTQALTSKRVQRCRAITIVCPRSSEHRDPARVPVVQRARRRYGREPSRRSPVASAGLFAARRRPSRRRSLRPTSPAAASSTASSGRSRAQPWPFPRSLTASAVPHIHRSDPPGTRQRVASVAVVHELHVTRRTYPPALSRPHSDMSPPRRQTSASPPAAGRVGPGLDLRHCSSGSDAAASARARRDHEHEITRT